MALEYNLLLCKHSLRTLVISVDIFLVGIVALHTSRSLLENFPEVISPSLLKLSVGCVNFSIFYISYLPALRSTRFCVTGSWFVNCKYDILVVTQWFLIKNIPVYRRKIFRLKLIYNYFSTTFFRGWTVTSVSCLSNWSISWLPEY